MITKEIFDLAVNMGIKHDPRTTSGVKEYLKDVKQTFNSLSDEKKAEFDKEKLTNPYSDSRFLAGKKDLKVKRVLVGIDIGVEEILLAKELERQGKKIDLIIAHHPSGKALAQLHEVMDLQTAVLQREGISENIAEGIIKEQLEYVSRRLAPINHFKPVAAAELLNIPFICFHTPADNCVWDFIEKVIKDKKPKKIKDVIKALKAIPEYKKATELGAGPVIFAGSENSRTGKIIISGMTGGTSGKGSEKIYERMSHFGIGTEIAMHIGDEDRVEAMKNYINIVIAGHIASDSLGMNLILDELEKKSVEIIPCSGLIRYSRAK